MCSKIIYVYTNYTKLYSHIFSSEDQDKLQNYIHKSNDWANQWLLKLNVEKCSSMTYTANISILCNTKYYTENSIERYKFVKVNAVSDLGARFDSKLAFLDHEEN